MSFWSPDSWKNFPIHQQPDWTDLGNHIEVLKKLKTYPPLVFETEIRSLYEKLSKIAQGNGFLIQGGDCAETFADFTANSIRDKLIILLQMSLVVSTGLSCDVVKLGRIAGQFAKPRSSKFEERGGIRLPSYRGDAVNDIGFSEGSRKPNFDRLLQCYNQSASTLNLLRGFSSSQFDAFTNLNLWDKELISKYLQNKDYGKMIEQIDEKLDCINKDRKISNSSVEGLNDFFTSHEALLLDYEEALTRKDTLSNDWYNCSAHFLWIGDRTRQLNGAHVEFLSGVKNPVGLKAGPDIDPDELIEICKKLNPENQWGRLSIITRLGAENIIDTLPILIKKIKKENCRVLWICDPMHGNTYKTDSGYKTRHFNTILYEIQQFFNIHFDLGTVPGGIHIELTSEDVTECLGGFQEIMDINLKERYQTACDPRLNNKQSLELAFLVTKLLRKESINF